MNTMEATSFKSCRAKALARVPLGTTAEPAKRKSMRMHNPPHPGEILREMWLTPLTLSVTQAARQLNVSRKTLSKIVAAKAAITPEMSLRLELACGKTAESWLGSQAAHDLWQMQARKESLGVQRLVAVGA